jgi:hypothetical protein
MVEASKSGKTVLATKATGDLTKLTAGELFGTSTEISMKVNGWMIRPTVMEPTPTRTEQDIRVTGKMICSMVTV